MTQSAVSDSPVSATVTPVGSVSQGLKDQIRPRPLSPAGQPMPSLPEAAAFVVEAVRRHWLRGFLTLAAVGLLVALYLVLAPRKYISTSKLYVRIGRESVTPDPTAATEQLMNVTESRENQINSALEIVNSHRIFAEVVRRLTPSVVLGDAPLSSLGDGQTIVARTTFKGPGALDDSMFRPSPDERKAIELLRKNIDWDVVRRSNILWATCVAEDPALAQVVLETYVDAAIGQYMQASRSDGSVDFFARQAAEVDDQYAAASAELAAIKSEAGVVSLADRRRTLQQQLSDIERDTSESTAKLAESEAALSGLRKALAAIPRLTTQTVVGQPQDAQGQAGQALSVLELKQKELLAKYNDAHPLVQSNKDQIDKAREIVDAAPRRKQATEGDSPVWQALETRRLTTQADIEALNARLTALRAERSLVAGRLAELNRVEAEIEGKESLVGSLRETRADYADRLEQARIDEALEADRLSNISIAQPATYESKPVSPKKRLTAVAGLLFGFTLAAAVILGSEYWRRDGYRWRHALAAS